MQAHHGTRLATTRLSSLLLLLLLLLLLADILKFYGCELGAQTNFDKSTGTSIVNGAHDNKVLCEKLEMFIKK
jgi:hypothetical protein